MALSHIGMLAAVSGMKFKSEDQGCGLVFDEDVMSSDEQERDLDVWSKPVLSSASPEIGILCRRVCILVTDS